MDRRYAIYGGTFDPIHNGHLSVAQAAVSECGLYRLIFMPDYISPFKLDSKVTSHKDRYEMIKRILHYNRAFTLSSYEINKEGPSYTVDTLEYWDAIINGEMNFVLGFDSILEIEKWKRGIDILKKYPLITAIRPGSDISHGISKIESLRSEYGADITVLDMGPVDASSSEIRDRIKKGLSISDLTVPEVEEYIIEHKLYR